MFGFKECNTQLNPWLSGCLQFCKIRVWQGVCGSSKSQFSEAPPALQITVFWRCLLVNSQLFTAFSLFQVVTLRGFQTSAVTLREAFQKEVAEPLGLMRTGFFQPLDEKLVSNAAFGGRLGIKEAPAHGYHYYPEHAAAGLWTTPTELVRVGLALSKSYREGGLLKKETARRMLTPALEGESYCLCVECFRGDIGYHGGCNAGF